MIVYYRMPHKEVEAPDFRPPYLASNDNRRCHMYAIIATASVVENGKAKKVIVYKYKRKTGYHKKNGHRQQFTKVKIEKINA